MRKTKKNVEHRPWGTYEVLQDKKKYKLKEIIVMPGQRLSYQSHHQRTEIWAIISGEGIVTLEGQELECYAGRSFFIPKEQRHRIECVGKEPLMFIEVQTGDYFGEDDIVRHEDDYGRK
jgi:mannose-6-phosphate isomerase|tara:strand:+ start:370 stop:726 length:357 start_codon:yes stop_codon:yes gene_type:complete